MSEETKKTWDSAELICRKHYQMAVIAHKLENSGRFYPVFYQPARRSPHGNYKIYERNPDGSQGRYLADFMLSIENNTAKITCQTDWRNLPPSDPVGLELEEMVKSGIEEVKWMMQERK